MKLFCFFNFLQKETSFSSFFRISTSKSKSKLFCFNTSPTTTLFRSSAASTTSLALVLLTESFLINRSDKHVNTHTHTQAHTQMYTNMRVSWVLYTNNHKSEVVQIWNWVLGELDSGPTIALNSISDFENVTFPLWTSISPFEKWWVWFWGCSFQLWSFITYESCLLLYPISIELKAHFFSFSPLRMIDSFILSNLITYFYIFVGYYVFLQSLFHMNECYKLSSPSKVLPSFFTIFFYGYFFEYYFLKPKSGSG